MEHRRSDRRYERRVAIDFKHEATTYSAFTRNISLGGVFIDTEQTLPFGAKLTLTFKIPTQSETVQVEGQVRWLELEQGRLCGLGVRFEGLRARDVWALNKFFERPLEEK